MNSDDEAAHRRDTAACDECRVRKVKCHKTKAYPKCSLCLKQNLPCLYTNKGKRVNHTTKLVHDVQQLGNRLGKIEVALERYISFMESSQHSLDGSTSQAGGPIRLTERKTPDHFPGPGHTLLVGDQVSESFLGPSSIPSLCVEAQATCERLASSLHILDAGGEQSLYSDHDTSALLANVAQANECLQHMVQETRTLPEPGDDEVAPTLPPRALLEASIHPYFKYISPILPIYERQSVIAAICGQYGADSPDPVWIIAFNSIVLQTLDAKLVATENIESIGYGGILEDALLYQLRLNVRRCYNNLKTLAHPSFVNAQALLSMALVALKYFHYTIFETVFVQACQVSRSIGLHRRSTKEREVDTEQSNVFWSLFIVDKHAAFIAGKACLLPSYDCSVALPCSSSNDSLAEYFAARIRLANLQEQVYRTLYSADAAGKEWQRIRHRARKVSQQLDGWATEHEHLLWPDASTGFTQQAVCAMRLRFSLSTCQLLLYRRTEAPKSEVSLQSARTCLALFKEVSNIYELLGVSGFGVFDSIVLYYSLAPFIEMYSLVLESHQHNDTELLAYFVSKSRSIAANTSPESNTHRIWTVASLCTQILHSLQILREKQSVQLTINTPPQMALPSHNVWSNTTSRSHSVSSSSMCLSTGDNETQFWNTYPHAVSVPFDTPMMNVAAASNVNYGTLLDGSNSYIEAFPSGMNSPRPGHFEASFDGLQGAR